MLTPCLAQHSTIIRQTYFRDPARQMMANVFETFGIIKSIAFGPCNAATGREGDSVEVTPFRRIFAHSSLVQ